MRVSFIVPAYNEEATIAEVLHRVSELEVENSSSSSTTAPRTALAQPWRRGPAVGTMSCSCPCAEPGQRRRYPRRDPHLDGQITVIEDADLEYDPVDVPASIEPMQRGAADVVFGSRLSGGRPQGLSLLALGRQSLSRS